MLEIVANGINKDRKLKKPADTKETIMTAYFLLGLQWAYLGNHNKNPDNLLP